ncbi:TonB-dependent receptor [Niabella terrae]
MAREILETKRKALKINLDAAVYGTFAEIGAGQEVARNFFTAGAASGTIAKTMSAYDMAFSNAIYGIETSGRYVTESRVKKMLDHEYQLLTERLHDEKYDSKAFFAFANTVTTLNFNKTNEPHGWVGLRFQTEPDGPANEIVFHVRLLDNDTTLQQSILGVLGVNLVYAAYYYHQDVQLMIESLVDNVSRTSVEIDMVTISGPVFRNANDRLANLYLIAKGYSDAAVFDPQGRIHQSKDMLYKKDIMILRTKYGQKSKPNFGLFNKAVDQFKHSQQVSDGNLVVLLEVLMSNLLEADDNSSTDLVALANRAEELCATGNNVIVSNFARNNKLARYLARCKPRSVGISTNISNLRTVFNAKKYGVNYTQELLSYISDLFSQNVKLYAYPYLNRSSGEVVTLRNIPVSPEARPLFDFLVVNGYIEDIEGYDVKDVKTV